MTHLEFDRDSRRLFRVTPRGSTEIARLTPLELRVIEHMFRMNRENHNRPAVCGFGSLTSLAWPHCSIDDARRYLSRLVFELRKKLEIDPSDPTLLVTHPRQGYALSVRPFCAVRARSPFVVGPPVHEPSAFFGRVREVKRLLALWMRRPFHSALIVGARRSGKTSLLRYVKELTQVPPSMLRPNQLHAWPRGSAVSDEGARPETYRIAYVDFQDPRTRRPEFVLGEILRACGMESSVGCEHDDFITVVSERLDAPTIVLLDEIEKGLHRPELAELWGTLRSAASRHPRQLLAFAVACRAIPSADDTSYESPLLNIIGEVIELGPFTVEEAMDLIAASPRAFPDADVAWMLEESARWPALLQVFCDARLNAFDTAEEGDWKRHALVRAKHLLHLKRT